MYFCLFSLMLANIIANGLLQASMAQYPFQSHGVLSKFGFQYSTLNLLNLN